MTQAAPPRLSILYDVHRVARLVHDLVEEALEDQPLSGTEFALYSLLIVTGPARVSEIATGIAAPLATASQLLDRLQARGHIEKTENPEDGRSTLVRLTEAGREAHRAAGRDFGAALRRVHDALGSARSDVAWALGRLDDALRSALAGAPVPAWEHRPDRSIGYDGPALTAAEEQDVRRHIEFLQWRREQA